MGLGISRDIRLKESAQTKENAHNKEKGGFQYQRQPIDAYDLLHRTANVFFGAGIHTFFAGNTFAVQKFVLSRLDAHRIVFPTVLTSFDTMLRMTFHR